MQDFAMDQEDFKTVTVTVSESFVNYVELVTITLLNYTYS